MPVSAGQKKSFFRRYFADFSVNIYRQQTL
jgi:hypothetical protein